MSISSQPRCLLRQQLPPRRPSARRCCRHRAVGFSDGHLARSVRTYAMRRLNAKPVNGQEEVAPVRRAVPASRPCVVSLSAPSTPHLSPQHAARLYPLITVPRVCVVAPPTAPSAPPRPSGARPSAPARPPAASSGAATAPEQRLRLREERARARRAAGTRGAREGVEGERLQRRGGGAARQARRRAGSLASVYVTP